MVMVMEFELRVMEERGRRGKEGRLVGKTC